jgi:hypothetical protein
MARSSNRLALATMVKPSSDGITAVGQVLRSFAGHYTCVVRIPGLGDYICSHGQSLSAIIGTSTAYVPTSGSRVIVRIVSTVNRTGTVIAVLPNANTNVVIPAKELYDRLLLPGYLPWDTCSCYMVPFADTDTVDRLTAGHNRALDLMPGEYAVLNQNGVGLSVLTAVASLKATELARLDVSDLDDQVRIVSGLFRHLGSTGTDTRFSDHGWTTQAVEICSRLCERWGQKQWDSLEEDPVLPRLQMLSGHLGDIFSALVSNPNTEGLPDALAELHLASSGHLGFRGTRGFSLQNSPRCYTVVKRFEPWDPEGHRAENQQPEPKYEYAYSEDHPGGRNLETRDALAYEARQDFHRILNNRDYDIVEATERPKPLYDPLGLATAEPEGPGTRSWVRAESDGSINIRSAGGASIFMDSEGNMTIDVPKTLYIRAGGDLVQILGGSMFSRTAEDTELVSGQATRISSASLDINAETTELHTGSGLLKADDLQIDTQTTGIRAGQKLLLHGKTSDSEYPDGQLELRFAEIKSDADDIALTSSGVSGIFLNSNGVTAAGPRAVLAGQNTADISSNGLLWVPADRIQAASDPYTEAGDTADQQHLVSENPGFMASNKVSDMEARRFEFKSSETYRGQDWQMYEPVWSHLKRNGHKVVEGLQQVLMPGVEVNGTKPFPGSEAWDTAVIRLKQEQNLKSPTEELFLDLQQVGGESKGFENQSMDTIR